MNDVIKLTDIIKIDEVFEYRIHACRYNNIEQPLDVFLRSKEEIRGWNEWKGKTNDFPTKYILMLIDFYHQKSDLWLFGGIYEITDRDLSVKYGRAYTIKEIPEYSKFYGRLKIHIHLARGRGHKLENNLEKMVVDSILPEVYSGEHFPGAENICHYFKNLKPIFDKEREDWKSALENIKGVYLIIDKDNGKKYVGSAYGEHGVWARWACYLGTGHGWNDELAALIQKKGSQYALENFQLSLLETFPMKTDDSRIIQRENFWKGALLSRGERGYNKN